MNGQTHGMNELFAQLGLPNDDGAIVQFIASHRPLPNGLRLHQASFWSPAEAAFLRDAFVDDADWAPIVDELNAELHGE